MSSVFDTSTVIPSAYVAGESSSWTENPSAYPASEYVLAYHFAGATPLDGLQAFTVQGVADGDSHVFTMPAATKPGIYSWQQFVTRSSDGAKAMIATGSLRISANLATAPTQTHSAKALAKIEIAIQSLASGTNQAVSINGQNYTKKDLKQLMEIRNMMREEVKRENGQISGRGQSYNIVPRFCS